MVEILAHSPFTPFSVSGIFGFTLIYSVDICLHLEIFIIIIVVSTTRYAYTRAKVLCWFYHCKQLQSDNSIKFLEQIMKYENKTAAAVAAVVAAVTTTTETQQYRNDARTKTKITRTESHNQIN